MRTLIDGFVTPISVAFLSDTKWLVIGHREVHDRVRVFSISPRPTFQQIAAPATWRRWSS